MDWKLLSDGDEKRHCYYASPEWSELKRQVKRRSQGKCEVCGENDATQTHHLTYIRLYHERLEDLEDICRPCHLKKHPHHNVKEDKEMGKSFDQYGNAAKRFAELVMLLRNIPTNSVTSTKNIPRPIGCTTSKNSLAISGLRHMGFLETVNKYEFLVTPELRKLSERTPEELAELWNTFHVEKTDYKDKLNNSKISGALARLGLPLHILQARHQTFLDKFHVQIRKRPKFPRDSKSTQVKSTTHELRFEEDLDKLKKLRSLGIEYPAIKEGINQMRQDLKRRLDEIKRQVDDI